MPFLELKFLEKDEIIFHQEKDYIVKDVDGLYIII